MKLGKIIGRPVVLEHRGGARPAELAAAAISRIRSITRFEIGVRDDRYCYITVLPLEGYSIADAEAELASIASELDYGSLLQAMSTWRATPEAERRTFKIIRENNGKTT